MIEIKPREVGLSRVTPSGLSKTELRRYLKVRGLGDLTHLGEPPAIYPEAAYEGDRVSIKANLCCTTLFPWEHCEGYVKFIKDGIETRVPPTSFSIPKSTCRWSPEYSFIMPVHDVIVTVEPWEEDPLNPDDRGESVDIVIKYLEPGEAPPTKDPLDSLIIWFETVRPRCFIGPLESLISGTATFIVKITPRIPILPG